MTEPRQAFRTLEHALVVFARTEANAFRRPDLDLFASAGIPAYPRLAIGHRERAETGDDDALLRALLDGRERSVHRRRGVFLGQLGCLDDVFNELSLVHRITLQSGSITLRAVTR